MKKDLGIRRAGVYGEKAVDYYLKQLDYQNHYILQDLRLPNRNGTFFQIDNLLFSPRYFLNYDSKNISGAIYIDEFQMTRKKDDVVESFPNPVVQVENQQYHLENLIANYTNICLPNNSFAVFTHDNSTLKIDPEYPIAKQKIIRPQQIRQKSSTFMEKHPNDLLDETSFKKIIKLLIKLDTPADPDILAEYQIKKEEILPGIYCEHCRALTVEKNYRTWLCKRCGRKSKDGYIRALIDYYLLIGPTITNSQCKYFLKLGSTAIASKLLRSLNLPFEGGRKHRVYKLSLVDLQNKLVDATEFI